MARPNKLTLKDLIAACEYKAEYYTNIGLKVKFDHVKAIVKSKADHYQKRANKLKSIINK